MEKLNVLVTGIGGPIAQGILQGLKKRHDVRLIGADRRELTTGNQFCDEVRLIPPLSERENYQSAILDIIERDEIDAIFPCLHEEAEIYQQFRHQLTIPVALPTGHHGAELLNKESVYQLMETHHLHDYIPHYYGFNTKEELLHIKEHHFPNHPYMVAKKVNGHGSLGYSVLMDRGDYLKAYQRGMQKAINLEDYIDIDESSRRIAMEYIDEPEYSVDVYIHEGQVITAVPRRRTGVSNGIVLDGIVEKHEELIEAATEISESLVVSGFLNLQFMGKKLTDLNPRFCGSQVMSLGANVNFPELFLQYEVLGEPVEVSPKWNTRMLRYRQSMFIHEE
ncbi:ATP-grasp domain-containing protein [Halobacillus litoralis]|uniref:ATP-grasp domain-containing protein n=1 Tax=Halobacillus litoralis TaxID=45668 RepID=UPI001CD42966|nr:ATP-grasp domain-containing protein [Halobacillus litoralis]MCA0970730.1 ATP-grasp domain-containing protein [Halobacillus litoralis]